MVYVYVVFELAVDNQNWDFFFLKKRNVGGLLVLNRCLLDLVGIRGVH